MNPNLTYKELLHFIDELNIVSYTSTRNHLDGAVSRLSPYLTRGVISLPAVRERILQKHSLDTAQKFIQELAWREYFQKVFASKQQAIFADLRFSRADWRHDELVSAIVSGETSIQAIDEQIAQLYETGYMHNHARMWTAMLACNVAKANWKNMSRWMYYHLIDGDLASNTLSWQWVSGTSIQKQYVADQALINACSDTNQRDTYLDIPRNEVGEREVPRELIKTDSFTYQTQYPASDELSIEVGQKVFAYHPWSIDPFWRADEEGERIFVIEPQLFDRFPVSEKVMKHMRALLKTHVPEAKVVVGDIQTIAGLDTAQVYSKAHPATTHFPGEKDATEELFPEVQGYYQSFFKFWQACEKV